MDCLVTRCTSNVDGAKEIPPSGWDQAGQALGLLNQGIDTYVKFNNAIISRQKAKLEAEKWQHQKNMQLTELCDKVFSGTEGEGSEGRLLRFTSDQGGNYFPYNSSYNLAQQEGLFE